MMFYQICRFIICVFVSQILIVASAQARDLLIVGSSTVSNHIFWHKKEEYQNNSGIMFDVIPSSSGRGIMALAQGRADIAMISSDLGSLVAKLNTMGEEQLNPDDFIVHPIAQSKVVFIVHPDNPLDHLSRAQVRDILTGKIAQWPDLRSQALGDIRVVTEHPTGGMYRWVETHVTDGSPFVAHKTVMQNAPQVALVVSQDKNAFGFVSNATPDEQMRRAKIVDVPDLDATQHLYFVTRVENTPESADVLISYLKEILAK
ncbi:MAG: hypothetical protein CL570_07750 [Alphaproteobacteria bacterium]|nr:hypothetical protein [Alphaproteobacteria bacterium]HCQ71211.1 hypothetical protein [Rhodospirillaceae bacterium]|tara:strand:+ start:33527 stop:34306 length:780 start_codon:yes stop_codon:yes gene_type:complete